MIRKYFSTLLTYILGVQLIFSAMPGMSFSSNAWAQSTCPAGLEPSTLLGRCVTSVEAAKIKENSLRCSSAGDVVAQRKCHEDAIKTQVANNKNLSDHKDIKTGTIPIILALASVAAGAYYLLGAGGKECPGATSSYLMIGGGVAVLVGEIWSAKKYKDKMKESEDLLSKMGDSSSSTTSDNSKATNIQTEAFTAMIGMEDATISAGKFKKTLYMVSLAAYAAAAVMAGIETFRYFNPYDVSAKVDLTCYGATTAYNKPIKGSEKIIDSYLKNYFVNNQRVPYKYYYSQDSVMSANSFSNMVAISNDLELLRKGSQFSMSEEAYNYIVESIPESTNSDFDEFLQDIKTFSVSVKNQILMPEAYAVDVAAAPTIADFVTKGGALPGEAGKMVKPAADGFKKLFLNPVTRLVFAGVLTANSYIMMNHISKEISKAEERKKFIEGLKLQTEAAGAAFGACSDRDRTDYSKPNCYCYTTTSNLNPARASSPVCKALFGNRGTLAKNKPGSSTAPKSCVGSRGQLDGSCSCQRNNSCLKVSSPSVVGSVPTGSILGNIPATLNGLNNGSISAADINGSQFGSLAARLNNLKDKMLADPKNKQLALAVKKQEANTQKYMDNMAKSFSASSPSLASSGSGSFMNATSPAEALAKMKEELKQEIKSYDANVVPVANGGSSKNSNDFMLDPLSDEGGVTIEDEQVAAVMANEYDMTAGEINSDSGANIFQILSNRYQRSGMRRLFGGEAIVPADAPSEEQVSQ